MKKYFFALVPLLLIQFSLSAQSGSDVFEKAWKGGSKARTDMTESGYFICTEQLYDIDYNDETNTFTGYSRTEFSFDYVTYVSVSKISGTVNAEDYSVVIKHDYSVRKDELPYDMYWIDTTLKLTLYTDEDHEGYYILSGQSTNMSYSDEVYEVTNYPY